MRLNLYTTLIFSLSLFAAQAQPFTHSVNCNVISFTNQDQSAVSYLWDFGDGNTSSLMNPIHIYTNPGVYIIVQRTNDSLGVQTSYFDTINLSGLFPVSISGGFSPTICEGGAISLTPTISGGVPPFNYAWSNGAVSDSITVAPAVSTTYSVTVTDAGGGCGTSDVSVTVNPLPEVVITQSQPFFCQGGTPTTLQAIAVDGVPPFNYVWSNLVTFISNPVAPQATTTYTVTVTDGAGCTGTASTTVITDTLLRVTATASPATICTNQFTQLQSTATGGAAPYSYQWTPLVSWMIEVSPTTTALPGASTVFTMTVTDDNGCTATDTAAVTVTTANIFSIDDSITPATCAGVCDGIVQIDVTGGASPYTWNWDGGPLVGGMAVGVCAGNYNVTITDSAGCTAQHPVTVPEADPLIVSFMFNPITCAGQCDAFLRVAGFNGIPPYTFNWSTGETTDSITNVCAGNYIVTVTDGNGCVKVEPFLIFVPDPLQASSQVYSDSCFGACEAVIGFYPSGGTPPYTYLWSTGNVNQHHYNLCAGDYFVTLTDSRQCTLVDTITVTLPPPIMLTTETTAETCINAMDGSAWVSVSGIAGNYAVQWSDGITMDTLLTGLSAGIYSVTVIESQHGCTATATDTVQQTGVNASVAVTSSTCGNADGTAAVTVTSGVAPFTFAWNTTPAQSADTATGLAAGSYTVTVTDSTGCALAVPVNISDIAAPVLTHTTFPATCATATNGGINLTVAGGTAPFTFAWDNGAATEDLNNIAPGTYNVNVTDSLGCIASRAVVVGTSPFVLTTTTTPASCTGADGTATVHVTGDTSIYTYSWNNRTAFPTTSGLKPGWYSVTVTDTFNCQRHTNVYVGLPANCIVTIAGTVYYDLDSNCVQDNGEPGIPNVMIDYEPGGAVFTQPDGSYSFVVPAGAYTVTQVDNSPHLSVLCPASGMYSVTLNNGGDASLDNDFGNVTNVEKDLLVNIACNVARPGFQQVVSVSVYNLGAAPADAVVEVVLDSRVTFTSATVQPVQTSGDTLRFSFTGIPVNGVHDITLHTVVDVQGTLGATLTHTASVLPLLDDSDPANNTDLCNTVVTGSYDPNEKHVEPKGTADGSIAQNDSVMRYTILFQNTGTDTAFTVVIKDTLDSNLDHKTFKMGTSSHPYSVMFEADNVIAFTFENILLPDSNVNEPESHGHVSFYMEHKGTLPIGETISNRAAIYFDYNDPIITNTVTNKIYDPLGIRMYSFGNFRIYPNPASDVLMVESLEQPFTALYVTDILGKRVYDAGSINSVKHTVRVRGLAPGVYFINVVSADGAGVRKVVVE